MKLLGQLALPVLYWAGLCVASPPEGALSFLDARERILANNGGLKAATTQVEAAQAGSAQAGVLLNPSIGIALDRFGANEIEASVEQTFELGGKRRLRSAVSRTEVDGAQNELNLTRVELDAEITRRFIPIAVGLSKVQVLDSIIAIAEASRNQIRARVEAGATKKTDLIRAEIDLEQHLLQRNELTRELASARRMFAALGGAQDSMLQNVSGELDESAVVPSLAALHESLVASPGVRASAVETAQLTAQHQLLKAEVAPDLGVSLGVLRSNAEGTWSPLVGVSTTLPLFNRNTAARNQVTLQRKATEERSSDVLRMRVADVHDLHSRLVEIDKKRISLRTGTLPKAEEVYAAILEYYNAGSAGYLDLAESRTDLLRLHLDLHDAEAERALLLADLMQITSLPINIVK